MRKLSLTEQRISNLLQDWGYTLDEAQIAALALAAKPEREETQLQKMANAMLDVSRWPKSKYPRVVRVAQAMLKEGKTPEEVELHYGFKDPGPAHWWFRRQGCDWRWRQDPTPDVILETCQKWEPAQTQRQISLTASPALL